MDLRVANRDFPPDPAEQPAAATRRPVEVARTRAPRLSRRRLIACLSALPLFLATACRGCPTSRPLTPTPTGPRPLRLAFPGGTSTDYVTTLVKDVAQHFPPEANLQLEPDVRRRRHEPRTWPR